MPACNDRPIRLPARLASQLAALAVWVATRGARRSGKVIPPALLCLLGCWAATSAQAAVSAAPQLERFGPYNVRILQGGIGLAPAVAADASVLAAAAPWSLTGWVRITAASPGAAVIGGFGTADDTGCDCLALVDGRLQLRLAGGARLDTRQVLEVGAWHALAATYDGHTARLYVDGRLIGSRPVATAAATGSLLIAPVTAQGHFGGSLAHWLLQSNALPAKRIAQLASNRPVFDLIAFYCVGCHWPLQKRAWRGLQHPQDPWTLPTSRAPVKRWQPHRGAKVVPVSPQHALLARGPGNWVLGGWRLRAAPMVAADGAQISRAGFNDGSWYAAVVPGTVLTTLVARGVYPDPYYGLDNLQIPERLSRQDYWYRTAFVAPAAFKGRQVTLDFNGINYAGAIWLNGALIGKTRGAFVRGSFDVTGRIRPGQLNVLAVQVSPPPHPGIPYEKSIAAGPGNNGGHLALDGPTFIATEGWDWMPPVRDRDTGLWQDVELHISGPLLLRYPHVVTHLPLPRTDEADVTIGVSVDNRAADTVPATVVARFGAVTVSDSVRLSPGVTRIHLTPKDFPALHVLRPRLWWPNGYGAPNLYHLQLSVYSGSGATRARAPSDRLTVQFGMREITYELSLFDHSGRLRRVLVDPTEATLLGEGRLIDVRHRAIERTPNGWAYSLTAAGETSPAVRPVGSTSLSPYLVIRVNGVRIAARGGSWGMDDAMKRVSRGRLEPYFRLTRAAHLDIIRNWLGQDTERTFYRLADQYGLLVLNDFWESTQNFQLEADDPQLFLANARQVLLRFRNHPSVAIWFGRNEGVPQPSIDHGLASLITKLDGTRVYMPSSNDINLQVSGPYDYRPPVEYFTQLARGFSVEVGTPSLASLRSLKAMMPAADLWPPSDTYAYHDWNYGGNGDVRVFMAAMDRQLGTPKNLADFERKAQLMDYVSYRAIFEGFNAGLWSVNSGRLLWMTQPAWPSNIWQIYTSDYATAGAYFGVKMACQPIHAQMNLPDFRLAVVDTTRQAAPGLTLQSRIFSLRGRLLATRTDPLSVAADSVTTLRPLELAPYLHGGRLVFVELELRNASGALVSRNVYWQGRTPQALRRLNDLGPQPVDVITHRVGGGPSSKTARIEVELVNRGREPAVAAHIIALDAGGQRVLPVYYSTNYVTLLPGEREGIDVRCPTSGAKCARIAVGGWNVRPAVRTIGAR